MPEPSVQRLWHPDWHISLSAILRPLQHGANDPCLVIQRSGNSESVWRSVQTPDGPAVQRLTSDGAQVRSTCWGPGAAFLSDRVPLDLGAADDVSGFACEQLVTSAHSARVRERAHQWSTRWRMPAVGAVEHVLVGAILGQRVTGIEAHRAWSHLVRAHGEQARTYASHAPLSLYVPPTLAQWRQIPSWTWHAAGVDAARSETVMRCLATIDRPDLWQLPGESVRARLRSVPGYGVWTDALLATRSFGDADAVPFRDFHVCHAVCHALMGDHRGSDEYMAELLEPWGGHRFRVVRLVELCGVSAPRRGPRLAPADHRQR